MQLSVTGHHVDVTDALREYGEFLGRHEIAPPSPFHLGAYCAAELLGHAIERVGRDLRRESLLFQLEGLVDLPGPGESVLVDLVGLIGVDTDEDPADNFSLEVFGSLPSGDPPISPTYLVAKPGERPFIPGVGENGGSLTVIYSDFSNVHEVAAIRSMRFTRGEVNGDGDINISDATALLNFLFLGGPPPCCQQVALCNGSPAVDLSQPVFGLNFLFLGGPPPPAPFPDCGGTGCPEHPSCN